MQNVPVEPHKDPLAPRRAFARHLRAMMTERHWNQSDVAREAWGDASRRDLVSKWLLCKSYPDRQHMADIAKAFGVDVADMLPAVTRAAHEVDESPVAFIDIQGEPDFQIVRMNWKVPRHIAKTLFDLVYAERVREREERAAARAMAEAATTPAKRKVR